jgi:electron transport complex protein RnfB
MTTATTRERILAILPQTQCQLCTYPSCQDYAEAVATGEATIAQCHPGGLPVLQAISAITGIDQAPYRKTVATQYKPPSRVRIDEDLCIGCTKCIQACPVDAIIGTSKAMHSIIPSECMGCDLCIPVCPVDCIHPYPVTEPHHNRTYLAEQFAKKTARHIQAEQRQHAAHTKRKLGNQSQVAQSARQAAIQAALSRVKAKKDSS